MKYIDEKRMRFGYIGLFVLSVGLIGAAFWDYTYNEEALLNWFVSALGGLLLIAIFFFVATELILKDALDLRPRRIAVGSTDEDHGAMPAQHQVPARAASKASMTADSAASLSSPTMARPSNDPAAARGDAWQPHVQAPTSKSVAKKEILKIDVPKTKNAPAVKKEILKIDTPKREAVEAEKARLSERLERAKIDMPTRSPAKVDKPTERIHIAMPETQFINAKPRETSLSEAMPQSPAAVPKPTKVQPAPQGVHLQTISYELGSSQFRVPRGSKGHRNPNAVLESTRVLCGDCGLYFRVDLDRARPMSVQCPQCSKDLGLSGAHQNVEHVKMRCRFCGDFLQMPRAEEHKATQCATCGQING